MYAHIHTHMHMYMHAHIQAFTGTPAWKKGTRSEEVSQQRWEGVKKEIGIDTIKIHCVHV